MVTAIILTVLAGVAGAGITFLVCRRIAARRRQQLLQICMHDAVTRSGNVERGDWFVRIRTDFFNGSPETVSIHRVGFQAVLGNGEQMAPKEICCDHTRSARKRSHPPDITMRLPIAVPHDGHLDYTFDVFFSSRLHRFWNGGKLQMRVENREGVSTVAEVPVPAPQS